VIQYVFVFRDVQGKKPTTLLACRKATPKAAPTLREVFGVWFAPFVRVLFQNRNIRVKLVTQGVRKQSSYVVCGRRISLCEEIERPTPILSSSFPPFPVLFPCSSAFSRVVPVFLPSFTHVHLLRLLHRWKLAESSCLSRERGATNGGRKATRRRPAGGKTLIGYHSILHIGCAHHDALPERAKGSRDEGTLFASRTRWTRPGRNTRCSGRTGAGEGMTTRTVAVAASSVRSEERRRGEMDSVQAQCEKGKA